MDKLELIDHLLSWGWLVAGGLVGIAALVRFSTRPAGLLLGGAFALMALKGAAMQVLRLTVLADLPFDDPTRQGLIVGSWALSLVLMLLATVGVLLIPQALQPTGEGPVER
jgi:hypothetical protein